MKLVVFADTSSFISSSSLSNIYRSLVEYLSDLVDPVPAEKLAGFDYLLVQFGSTVVPQVPSFSPLKEYCGNFASTFYDFRAYGQCNFGKALALLKEAPEDDDYVFVFLTNGNPTDSRWKKELKKLKNSSKYQKAPRMAIYFEGYVDNAVLEEIADSNVYRFDEREKYVSWMNRNVDNRLPGHPDTLNPASGMTVEEAASQESSPDFG